MFGSVSFHAMSSALDALSLRQRTTADNIANVQTPNFQARKVQFEDALKSAVASGSGDVTATVGLSIEPTREDGNNVNLDTETISNIDTNLRYQVATQAMNSEFKSLRSAIGNA
ncbi:flagellar basal body rod protein FlgB [Demequina salsinemoris]|uniref:flagellar basal body rod protein FlgB n=1 Tax=Demequina salsinemoris TaxID=577470 RepID=UPI00078534E0|nr:flagellar basal body protein [Demequina salsinemoris]